MRGASEPYTQPSRISLSPDGISKRALMRARRRYAAFIATVYCCVLPPLTQSARNWFCNTPVGSWEIIDEFRY